MLVYYDHVMSFDGTDSFEPGDAVTFRLLRPGKRENNRQQKGRVVALNTTPSGTVFATVAHDGGAQDGLEERVVASELRRVCEMGGTLGGRATTTRRDALKCSAPFPPPLPQVLPHLSFDFNSSFTASIFTSFNILTLTPLTAFGMWIAVTTYSGGLGSKSASHWKETLALEGQARCQPKINT